MILLRFANVISGYPVHDVLYICNLRPLNLFISIRLLMDTTLQVSSYKYLVEDKTDIPRISSKTRITSCKPN